jgi:3-deoxy-D-manno-octulosonic-acid transferase
VSILVYNLFLWFYGLSVRLVSPWNRKASLWLKGRHQLLRKIENAGIGGRGKLIWMHCASLGEFEQGRPVLEALKKNDPDCRFLLTFFSPSGFEVRKNYSGADYIFYLPADSRGNARRFLDAVRPDLVLWIKYDYWYYYLSALHKREIPVLLISALFRRDQPFFKRYGRLHRSMLDCFNRIFVQTESAWQLLSSIGFSERAIVSGDTRFDRVIEIATAFEPLRVIAAFCGDSPVIVAGSTWEEDEEELDHYANTHPQVKFIIAPHEIEEVHLRDVEGLFHRSIRYSVLEKQQGIPGRHSPNVLIIDNIGMLSRLYKYARIAYVGGGFGDDGVHNVLEAAVFGVPVVMGPVIEKYFEATGLVDSGGGIVIDNALEAEKVFERLLADPEEYALCSKASREYVYSKQGATQKIVSYVQENRLLTT